MKKKEPDAKFIRETYIKRPGEDPVKKKEIFVGQEALDEIQTLTSKKLIGCTHVTDPWDYYKPFKREDECDCEDRCKKCGRRKKRPYNPWVMYEAGGPWITGPRRWC